MRPVVCSDSWVNSLSAVANSCFLPYRSSPKPIEKNGQIREAFSSPVKLVGTLQIHGNSVGFQALYGSNRITNVR